jgi:nanoRNase/pAp phosphatase (c-di-AMP/oligoRNAs hydrolase)
VSFRSRGHNVAELAQSLNEQGGGHTAAAGCNMNGTRDQVLELCHRGVRRVLGL